MVSVMQTLKALLEQKKVDYDFSFYTLPVNTDVVVTVLSEKKSLLHASLDVTLPLKACQAAGKHPSFLSIVCQRDGNAFLPFL